MKLEMPSKIGRRYRCLREIGRGATGIVYEVVDEYTGVHRALKVITLDLHDAGVIARFSREARVASVVGGEHVVKVIDTDVASDLGDRPYVVMELLRGRNVEQLLASGEPLWVETAHALLRQLADALERTHEAGIVHRALRPSNLFVHEEEDGSVALEVLDFGIAKLVDPLDGEAGPAGPASDLRAVARIAAAMLSSGPTGLVTTRGFESWYAKSCSDGFETAREQIEALGDVMGGAGRSVAPVAYAPEVEATPMDGQAPASRSRTRVGALASGGIALVLFGVLVGRAIFGGATAPAHEANGAASTAAREAVVERNELVVASMARAPIGSDVTIEGESED